MIDEIISKFHNPSPSYAWESLNLDEVKRLTNIQLNHKGWKYYFTNFHDFQDAKHTKECYEKANRIGYKDCDCKISSCLVAIWKAGTLDINGVGRGREFFVNVPHEKIEDRIKLTSIESRPKYVQELLYKGFEQLITLLKVYEVTGLVLRFGPPMMLYTESSYKHRKGVREIDGDILWDILHDVKEEKPNELKQVDNLVLIKGTTR